MSKKTSTIIKVVAFVAGVAAVGAACYIYRDKIKEFFEKIKLKEKFEAAKTFITDKLNLKKEEDFFDDAEFFDDESIESEDAANRGYTSINISSEEDAPSKEETPIEDTVAEEAKKTESAEDTEDIPFEYEGLSDVSEDEEVLDEEASLEGDL